MKHLIFAIFVTFPFLASALTEIADSCAKTCMINAECGVGGICEQGQCRYENHYCFSERWSVNERGETSNCDGYRCSSKTGLCLRQAENSEDCLFGFVFDGKKSCVASVQCNLSEASCQDLFDRWKKARDEYEAATPEPQATALTCQPCPKTTDCGAGKMCWHGHCEKAAAFCTSSSAGNHYSIHPQRPPMSCGNYLCEKVSGLCLSDCLKNSDCHSGKTCVAGACL